MRNFSLPAKAAESSKSLPAVAGESSSSSTSPLVLMSLHVHHETAKAAVTQGQLSLKRLFDELISPRHHK